jgi:CheY-like chemotaxis protein
MSRILVVDDSPVELRNTAKFLEENLNDVEVLNAGSGDEAIHVLECESVDLILTDMNMPGMSGLDLVHVLKDAKSDLPVVLMTGFGNESLAVSALTDGAVGYVPKTALLADLIPTMERVLDLSRISKTNTRLMSKQTSVVATFVIDNDASLVPSLVGVAQEHVLRMQMLSSREVTRLGVALTEALLNAIYHGNLEVSSDLRQQDESIFYIVAEQRAKEPPYRDRKVHITMRISAESARFTIRDEGPGFDVKSILDPNREIDLDRIGGRGLLLIQHFVDVVYHNPKGNEIELIKYSDAIQNQPESSAVESKSDCISKTVSTAQ